MHDGASTSWEVTDSIGKVNGELAVGADMRFQKTWWRVERVLWGIFGIVMAAALAGLLGRGAVSHTTYHSPDSALSFEYERIQRIDTPSTLTLHFPPQVVQSGHVALWIGAETLRDFGVQRTAPTAVEEIVQSDGEVLVFPALPQPLTVRLFLRSTVIGRHRIDLQVHGSAPASVDAMVLP